MSADSFSAGSTSVVSFHTEAVLNVPIPERVLIKLFADEVLCANDVRCLDSRSRCSLRRLCLSSCALCIFNKDRQAAVKPES